MRTYLELMLLSGRDFSMSKIGLDLEFANNEDAQNHVRHRNMAGGVGTLVGGALGGAIGGKLKGVPGAIGGSLLGAYAGSGPGRLMADIAHDVPQRTHSMYGSSMHRMEAAGGAGMRLAAALPSATDFAEFAQSDHTGGMEEPVVSGFEQDALDRLRDAGLGHTASLEGGDAAARNEVMGLPKYDGV